MAVSNYFNDKQEIKSIKSTHTSLELKKKAKAERDKLRRYIAEVDELK
jgi:hypothetical protein